MTVGSEVYGFNPGAGYIDISSLVTSLAPEGTVLAAAIPNATNYGHVLHLTVGRGGTTTYLSYINSHTAIVNDQVYFVLIYK